MKIISQKRADCLSSLKTYVNTMFEASHGIQMKDNYHIDLICESLELVLLGKITRLIVTMPPRSGKTEIIVKGFISWATGIFPDSEWIHASYSKRLAANNAYGVREIMRQDAYSQIFPNVKIKQDSSAKDEFRTEQGGVVYATGSEGSITGRGAGGMGDKFKGAIVIDDALKPGEAASETIRTNIINWFSTTMESRKNSISTPIVIVQQRLHEEDLAGFLLSGGNNEHWDHLNIPAIDDNGESFWEDQFPKHDLKRKEKSDPYVFAGQYMQAPSPAGGGMFKDEYWNYYDVLPPDIDLMRIYGDTAQKTAEHNDYSVFQLWGRSHSKGLFLVDQCRGKWEAPELETMLINFWNKHRPTQFKRMGAQVVKIEDKSSGSSLIQSIQRDHLIPVEAIQRNKDKVFRATGVVKYFASGYIHLPKNTEWVYDYTTEFSKFTPLMNHKHDDQIDPTMDAVEDLLVFNDTMFTENLL